MANGTIIQARVDKETKQKARGILNNLGISMSEAITMFFKQIVLHRGIPFEIKIPNEATSQAIEELESGKGKKFASVDELFKELEN
jgi:DNA-damage-inducible protein J